MNYFNFHVGDYAAHTAHLTWEEDLIYRRLLDLYYLHERALAPDVQKLARVIRMPKSTAAIEAVLDEFFQLQEDGWHNKRADAELDSMGEKQEINEERTNHEKDRQKRYRERRSAMFEALRPLGIVPAWDVSMKDLQRLHEQYCNAPATEPETDLQRNGDVSGDAPATAIPTPTPTPIPKEEKESRSHATRPPTSRPKSEQTTLAAYLATCKATGAKPVPDGHAIRRWCEDAGITAEMLQVAWVLFRERYTEGEKGKRKRYVHWADHFATAVKDNWAGLWFMGDDNRPAWTSKGLTHKAVLDARMANREAVHG